MVNQKSHENFISYTLGFVLALLAINAFLGGYYGMTGAKNVPIQWLKTSPSHSYFIPSLILFMCVGGSALIAAVIVFRRHRMAREAAFVCGVVTLVWLIVQIAIIGYVSWMQPTTAAVAIIILVLTLNLPSP